MARQSVATAEDLVKMKKELEVKDNRVRTLQGKESALMDRLKKEFSIVSLEKGEKELADLGKSLTTRDAEFLISVSLLKEKFAWSFKMLEGNGGR